MIIFSTDSIAKLLSDHYIKYCILNVNKNVYMNELSELIFNKTLANFNAVCEEKRALQSPEFWMQSNRKN